MAGKTFKQAVLAAALVGALGVPGSAITATKTHGNTRGVDLAAAARAIHLRDARAVPAALRGKLDERLANLAHTRAAHALTRVVFELRGASAPLLKQIRLSGGRVEARYGNLVQALIPPRAIESLAANSDIRRERPPGRAFPLAIPGEGVTVTNASAWQPAGLTGAGVKVAIIDVGFKFLKERQAGGEIPASVQTIDMCDGHFYDADVHGTAVTEIVAEEAPGAALSLICVDSEVTLGAAETWAKANGIQIVSHSVGWFNSGRGDGSGGAGTADAIVADARAHGILWVNAAGNEAFHHWSGVFSSQDGDNLLDFAPGQNINWIDLPDSGLVCAFLRWDDWPSSAGGDYDLYLYDDESGRFIASSVRDQGASQGAPMEDFCWWNDQRHDKTGGIVIVSHRDYAHPPQLDLFVEGSYAVSPKYTTPERSIVDPASSPSVLAVGAICWQSRALEPYSSHGPTIDGRTKPDLVATDSVSSATYGAFRDGGCGRSGFTGTSAATPYVAGAAALVKARFPSLSVSQLQRYLVSHVEDLGAQGADDFFGTGSLLLPPLAAPSVDYPSKSARGITASSVALKATVNAHDSDATVTFEYGTTTKYGSATRVLLVKGDETESKVSVSIAKLRPGTTYHFRVVAKNLGGTTVGLDRTFTTSPAHRRGRGR